MVTLDAPSEMQIEEAMRTRNCIVMGGPKHNRSTRAALEALWPDQAPPLTFIWDGWPADRAETPFEARGDRRGLVYRDHDDRPVELIDRAPDRPAGALVVCRSPLGTTEPVMTIIVAGCSTDGTERIVQDVLAGAVPLDLSLVEPGRPLLLILRPTSRAVRWYSPDAERVLMAKRAQRRQARNARRRPSAT